MKTSSTQYDAENKRCAEALLDGGQGQNRTVDTGFSVLCSTD